MNVKTLSILVLLFLNFSCDKKNNKGLHPPLIPIQDKDHDGLNDSQDPHPSIVNLPQLAFNPSVGLKLRTRGDKSSSQVIELTFNPTETKRNNVLRWQRRALMENDESELKLLTHKSEDLILGPLNPQQEFLLEDQRNQKLLTGPGQLEATFSLSIRQADAVDSLSDIQFTTLIGEFSQSNFYLLNSRGHRESIYLFQPYSRKNKKYSWYQHVPQLQSTIQELQKAKDVVFKVQDFQFKRQDQTYSFKKMREQAREKMATLLYSTPEKTEIFYVSPGKTLIEILNELKIDYSLDSNGHIRKISHYHSQALLPINFSSLSQQQAKMGVWSLFGLSHPAETFEAGNSYLLSFASLLELASNENELKVMQKKWTANHLNLGPFHLGQTLWIKLQGIHEVPQLSNRLHASTKSWVTRTVCVNDDIEPLIIKGNRRCRDKKVLGWCGFYYRTLSYQSEKVDFSSSSLPILVLKLGSKETVKLSNLRPILSTTGKSALYKIKLTPKNYRSGERLTLIRQQDQSPTTYLRYGFEDYADCQHRFLGRNFELNFDTGLKQANAEGRYQYDVLMKTR